MTYGILNEHNINYTIGVRMMNIGRSKIHMREHQRESRIARVINAPMAMESMLLPSFPK